MAQVNNSEHYKALVLIAFLLAFDFQLALSVMNLFCMQGSSRRETPIKTLHYLDIFLYCFLSWPSVIPISKCSSMSRRCYQFLWMNNFNLLCRITVLHLCHLLMYGEFTWRDLEQSFLCMLCRAYVYMKRTIGLGQIKWNFLPADDINVSSFATVQKRL